MRSFASLRDDARVLLVNPPVADTIEVEQQEMLTCVQPFGLLRLATHLRNLGCRVELLDCLRHPALAGRVRRRVRSERRCGNFAGEGISKPIYHFGLEEADLLRVYGDEPPPDCVAIGLNFTWQLPAYRDAVRACKRLWPSTPVVLGGNAVTLCPDEVAQLGADELVGGQLANVGFQPTAIDLVGDRTTDFLQMVKGCPHRCSYCVTPRLHGGQVVAREPEGVFAELRAKQAAHGTRCFVFYDDFVLYQPARHLEPFLDLVAQERPGVTLEFALGFSAPLMTEALAGRLRAAGVRHVVIALETTSAQRGVAMHRPQSVAQFVRAVQTLQAAGFAGAGLRAFYLIGLPGQTTEEILKAILFLYHLGVTPSLTAYALTPGSEDMERFATAVSGRSLEELSPGLWAFAHAGMTVRELDTIYRYYHERFIPLSRIESSPTDDPVVVAMQAILKRRGHLPENW